MTLTLCASPPFRMHVPFKQAYDALLAIRAERAVHAAASVEARDTTVICFVAPRTFSISPGQTKIPDKRRFCKTPMSVGCCFSPGGRSFACNPASASNRQPSLALI